MSSERVFQRIAIIGFGEAGGIIGEDLAKTGCEVVTYDILLDNPASRAAMLSKAQSARVRAAENLRQAILGAELVVSAVTATSSADVARDAAAVLKAGQTFLDINSVSPDTKRSNAQLVGKTGADYVEAAVMAPVPPQRLAVPMLLGGPRAATVAAALRTLGMNTTAIADEIGIASAVKMCRSIVIKGLEAITLECVFAARRFGAEREVLASLHNSFPHMGWSDALPDYLVSRIAEHGRRRAAEMREVAQTLESVGIEPIMATATSERHDQLIKDMASAEIAYRRDEPFSWRALADALAAANRNK